MAKISIIVPTYNERDNLHSLTSRVHSALSDLDYELLIVDDNSPDGTGALAEKLAREKPIKVLHRKKKLGLASAVVEGFNYANGEIIGVIDADLQHPPEMIPNLIERMDSADIVIGSRYVHGGGVHNWTLTRELVSRVAKVIPPFLFAKIRSIKDPLSGFFFVRKKVIEGVSFDPIGYKILLEILIRGKHNGIIEVPYTFQGRENGESNLNTTEQFNYLRHLYRLSMDEGEPQRFVKFCLVGSCGVIVNLGTYWLLTRVGGIMDLAALIISIEASILSNFALNERWTFRDMRAITSISQASRVIRFNTVSLVGATLNFGLFYILTRQVGLFDMFAELFAIIMATLLNFMLNKWWTWK